MKWKKVEWGFNQHHTRGRLHNMTVGRRGITRWSLKRRRTRRRLQLVNEMTMKLVIVAADHDQQNGKQKTAKSKGKESNSKTT